MNRLVLCLTLVAGVSGMLMERSASAAPITIIDQQNSGPRTAVFTNFSFFGDGVTQGFTPTLGGMDALELNMQTTGTSTDIRIDVFLGDGDGGPMLGSSGILTIVNAGFALTHFDFASTVALTSGLLYSFRLTHLGGDPAAFMEVTGNNYAVGIPRNPNGTSFTNFDLVFTEGLHNNTPPVPEPTSMALFGLTALGMGVMRRRKKKATEEVA